jgi:hypothetical protein
MKRKYKKILNWVLLFLGVTAATSLIGYKTEGFTVNPFAEIHEVEDDGFVDEDETPTEDDDTTTEE